jgi:hypothetical protein
VQYNPGFCQTPDFKQYRNWMYDLILPAVDLHNLITGRQWTGLGYLQAEITIIGGSNEGLE